MNIFILVLLIMLIGWGVNEMHILNMHKAIGKNIHQLLHLSQKAMLEQLEFSKRIIMCLDKSVIIEIEESMMKSVLMYQNMIDELANNIERITHNRRLDKIVKEELEIFNDTYRHINEYLESVLAELQPIIA